MSNDNLLFAYLNGIIKGGGGGHTKSEYYNNKLLRRVNIYMHTHSAHQEYFKSGSVLTLAEAMTRILARLD